MKIKPSYEDLEQRIKELEKQASEHSRIEEKLKEDLEMYRVIFENASMPIHLLDPDTMEYKLFNREAYESLGYTKDELKNMKPGDLILEKDEGRAKSHIRKTLETGSGIIEARVKRKDGEIRDILITSVPISIGDKRYLQDMIVDITDRKKAEEALRESEEIYRKTFEHAKMAIILQDAEGGEWIKYNKEAYESLGYTKEEYENLTVLDIQHEDSPTDFNDHLEKILKEGSAFFESILKKKNGVKHHILTSCVLVNIKGRKFIQSINVDISRRIKMERALKESQEFIGTILENSPIGIIMINRDYKIEYVNPFHISLTGFSPEELLGKGYPFPWWDDSRELISEEDWQKVTFEGFRSYELPFKKKNGERLWVEVSSTPIKKDGEYQYSLISWLDITSRKQAQEEKESMRAKYERGQRMEALGTLAGGMAHDFNNLLMGIQGRASLMLLDKNTHDQDYEHLKGIEDYVKNATAITKQLLGFARGGKYEVKPVNLNDLLKQSVEMFGRMKKEVNIKTNLSDDLWTSEVDQGQINQVLMNIFINAWQAMPGGGELYIESENVDLVKSHLKPYEIKPGRHVKISIADNGIGMDKAVQSKIFDPFFTTKEKGRGTGLGLASVYGIVKNHGGYIDVYSEKGEGTTFKIYFPASVKDAIKEEKSKTKLVEGKETILLVDDEDIVMDVGKSMLEKLGYTVLSAQNGNEAIKLYEENKEDIDMVILDMIMPGINGEETFERLKEINSEIKVLLSSGYSMNGQAHAIMKKGCGGFIQKPFDIQNLSQKVREVL